MVAPPVSRGGDHSSVTEPAPDASAVRLNGADGGTVAGTASSAESTDSPTALTAWTLNL
jgi:hypothetical protein